MIVRADSATRRDDVRRMHYGWVIVAMGVLVSMAALGLGRFAFGMLVPSMQGGLVLSYEQMGWIGTGNFLGYLLGASSSGALTTRSSPRAVISASMALIAVSLTVVSGASGFWPVLLSFTLTGLGSGASNVAMLGLLSHWFLRSIRGWAAGLVVAGSGVGLMITGLLVPAVNTAAGAAEGWRVSWRIMAVVVAVVALLTVTLLRNDPREIGISPAGHPVKDAVVPPPVSVQERRTTTTKLGLIYAMFGFSYAIYVTFIVASLVHERGIAESSAGLIWSIIGFLSLFCSLFGALSDRIGRKLGLVTVFGLQAAAYLIVGLQLPGALLYVSVFLFGICAWSIPGIMGAAVGDYMPPEQAIKALGLLTIFFGAGQTAGPAIAGVLGDRTGDFSSSYLLAATAAILGLVGSLAIRQPGNPHQRPARP